MLFSLLVTLGAVFAAALLRGFTGFGFGLAAVPLLSLALPPASVVPLVVTLQVIVGVAGLRPAGRDCDWRAVGTLLPGLVAGIPCGLAILTSLPANPVRLLIGLLIAASVWLIQRDIRLPQRPSGAVGFGVGFVSGVINGLASVGGPPVIVYLLALGHGASRMRSTAIVYFMAAAALAFLPMAVRGMIRQQTLLWAAAAIPVLFGGSHLGSWAFLRAKPSHHRLVALMSLSGLALLLIGRAALGQG